MTAGSTHRGGRDDERHQRRKRDERSIGRVVAGGGVAIKRCRASGRVFVGDVSEKRCPARSRIKAAGGDAQERIYPGQIRSSVRRWRADRLPTVQALDLAQLLSGYFVRPCLFRKVTNRLRQNTRAALLPMKTRRQVK